ncbi:MAG: hypothetical protein Q7S74_01510 [Nanoarchaeota archaeon]|nr:hypothetical protein [Nanoarchaeota archaeon]
MRIRIKEKIFGGFKRIDSSSVIDNIELKKDLMTPEKGAIHIYFKGKHSSGILNLSEEEARKLVSSIKPLIDLVRVGKRL